MTRNLQAIVAKVENAYGTFANPAVNADVQVVGNWTPDATVYDRVQRRIKRAWDGAMPEDDINPRQSHSLEVDMVGGGAVATPPRWALWLRAMMFAAPSVTAGVKVTYPLESVSDGASLSLGGWEEDEYHEGRGFRANGRMIWQAGDVPFLTVDGLALADTDPVTDASGALTYPAVPAGVYVNELNTLVELDGYQLHCRRVELNLGLQPVHRLLTGQRMITFSASNGSRRNATLTIVAEAPKQSDKDIAALANGMRSFSLTHGTVPGHIHTLTSTQFRPMKPKFGYDGEGIREVTITGSLVPLSGAGSEFVFETK